MKHLLQRFLINCRKIENTEKNQINLHTLLDKPENTEKNQINLHTLLDKPDNDWAEGSA
jgi:hypothetical protein